MCVTSKCFLDQLQPHSQLSTRIYYSDVEDEQGNVRDDANVDPNIVEESISQTTI